MPGADVTTDNTNQSQSDASGDDRTQHDGDEIQGTLVVNSPAHSSDQAVAQDEQTGDHAQAERLASEKDESDQEPVETSKYVDASTQTGDWIMHAMDNASRKSFLFVNGNFVNSKKVTEWAVEDVRTFYKQNPCVSYRALPPNTSKEIELDHTHKRHASTSEIDDRPAKRPRIGIDATHAPDLEAIKDIDQLVAFECDAWAAEPATALERNADHRFPSTLSEKYGKAGWPILKKWYEIKIAEYKAQGIEKTLEDIDAEEDTEDV